MECLKPLDMVKYILTILARISGQGPRERAAVTRSGLCRGWLARRRDLRHGLRHFGTQCAKLCRALLFILARVHVLQVATQVVDALARVDAKGTALVLVEVLRGRERRVRSQFEQSCTRYSPLAAACKTSATLAS